MATYQISFDAENDLNNIFFNGAIKFGEVQAEVYFEGLFQHLQRIADAPLMYPYATEGYKIYRKSVYKAHTIYYRIENEQVNIVRIIGRQDTKSLFETPID